MQNLIKYIVDSIQVGLIIGVALYIASPSSSTVGRSFASIIRTVVEIADGLHDGRIERAIDALHVDDAVGIERRDELSQGAVELSLGNGQAFEESHYLYGRRERGYRDHLQGSAVVIQRHAGCGQVGHGCARLVEHADQELGLGRGRGSDQ